MSLDLRDTDADELVIVIKALEKRITAWGKTRKLSLVEAAISLMRDRLDDLETRARTASKLTAELSPAERSKRGKAAIKVRWDKHFASTPKVEKIWKQWVKLKLLDDRREYDREDIMRSEDVTNEEAKELMRRVHADEEDLR